MSERIPPLAALRAFAAVARLGSFSRAAGELNVSTSAVSHQVRGLEDTLGATLLTRARNGSGRTIVTAEGAALQRAVEQAFDQLGAACEAVRSKRRGPVLTISANGSVASLWLAPRLASFAALHPSVQWQLRAIEDNAPDMVREGLDLAILRAPRGTVPRESEGALRAPEGAVAKGPPGGAAERAAERAVERAVEGAMKRAVVGDQLLFSETVSPVCSPSLLVSGSPDALWRHTLLQEEHGSSPEKDWSTWLPLLGCGPATKTTVVRFHTFNAALAAAIAGAGIALGRQPLNDAELAAGRLVRPFPDRAMPGSFDFVIRRRPGAARDGHVAQLLQYLL
jgi:LysR family glycine cleavage system transcriptional activator